MGRRHKLLLDWAPSLALEAQSELTEHLLLVQFLKDLLEGVLARDALWYNDDQRFAKVVDTMVKVKAGVVAETVERPLRGLLLGVARPVFTRTGRSQPCTSSAGSARASARSPAAISPPQHSKMRFRGPEQQL